MLQLQLLLQLLTKKSSESNSQNGYIEKRKIVEPRARSQGGRGARGGPLSEPLVLEL